MTICFAPFPRDFGRIGFEHIIFDIGRIDRLVGRHRFDTHSPIAGRGKYGAGSLGADFVKRRVARFAGANADRIRCGQYEDLAVAGAARLIHIDNRLHRGIDHGVRHHDGQHAFGNQFGARTQAD